MATIWIEDESTGIEFEFEAIWEWESVGIGWYNFWGHEEFDDSKAKKINEIQLVDWDTNGSDYSESEKIDVKVLGEQFLVNNYPEIERKLYEVL